METLQTSGMRNVEPIVLDNFVLDGEAVRGADGRYLTKSQRGWEQHFAGTGKHLPTVREYVTFMKYLQETNHPALPGLLQDLRENALCTGTKIDYRNSNIPVGDGYLDQLVKDSAWRTALEDEVLQYDAQEAVSVLQRASGKRPYLWTPSADGRKSRPERAVWLYIDTDWFYLNGYDPIADAGRSRGVREVGASARAKKSGPAMTEEERLTARIEGELSRFDGFAGTYSQEQYAHIKQEVAQNLKGLYKK